MPHSDGAQDAGQLVVRPPGAPSTVLVHQIKLTRVDWIALSALRLCDSRLNVTFPATLPSAARGGKTGGPPWLFRLPEIDLV
jgi:hypothetical protein